MLKQLLSKKIFVTLWLSIIAFSVSGQFNQLKRASEALSRLDADVPDSARLNILYDLAYYYIAKPGENKIDLDSGLDVLKRSVPLVNKLKDAASTGAPSKCRTRWCIHSAMQPTRLSPVRIRAA
ncbi:MAG: hypothetical protein JST68_18785 [Bacteroidetes bacterium]|nr:hypothetical protein [Bacteroidota bacterium]